MPIILNAPAGGAYVVTFTDRTPSPRNDGTPWVSVQVEEAAAQTGPWTVLATAPLDPLDADPAHPLARDITLTGATLAAGWYRLTFLDAAGHQEPTAPVLNGPAYTATREDVARILKARTRDTTGNIGAFNANTNPTATEVDELIGDAVASVAGRIGAAIPDDKLWLARRAVALKAAMLIELSVTPEQTAGDETAYGRLRELFDEAMAGLRTALDGDQPGRPNAASVPVLSPTLTAYQSMYGVSTAELLP